ncbi:MAG: hypothetical protein KJ646_04445 [Nanoarchaeota archaeon]|nr:hypothetical protein [Nanoarchaeota archaeon]
MKILGKTLKEYIWPIKFYILASILIVVSQYYIGLPLQEQYPIILRITQGLWATMVALSVLTLIRMYKDFDMKNVIVLGIFYSIIIHGLKAFVFRVFLFPYEHIPSDKILMYLINKFLYGSFLVMVVVVIIGIIFIYLRNKNQLGNKV